MSAADGIRRIATVVCVTIVAVDCSGGGIWSSTDSGATWNEIPSMTSSIMWHLAIAMSADGCQQFAGAYLYNGNICQSTDSGVTWTEDTNSAAPARIWIGIAVSSDGTFNGTL